MSDPSRAYVDPDTGKSRDDSTNSNVPSRVYVNQATDKNDDNIPAPEFNESTSGFTRMPSELTRAEVQAETEASMDISKPTVVKSTRKAKKTSRE